MKANRSKAATISKGQIVTFVSPAQGKKNLRLARKKAAALNQGIKKVTLKRS